MFKTRWITIILYAWVRYERADRSNESGLLPDLQITRSSSQQLMVGVSFYRKRRCEASLEKFLRLLAKRV